MSVQKGSLLMTGKQLAKKISLIRFKMPKLTMNLVIMVVSISCAMGQESSNVQDSNEVLSYRIKSHQVDIWSDGTRLSGDLFYPDDPKIVGKLPAIILCHGWGGLRSHLNKAYAPMFAQAGYVVLTFDYRGWGNSDSRLVLKDKMPKPDANGLVTVKVLAIRELVDPFDQVEDIGSAIDFIIGESRVDKGRIGLWGTSFGGGHVVYVAAHDRRIKCIVSQVPSMDGNWVNEYFKPAELATQRARGEIEPVPQGVNQIPGLRGTPYLSRIAKYRPVLFSEELKVPILIIVAEEEELMDNRQHGEKVYNLVKNNIPAKYEIFPGTHYEIYDKNRVRATKMAIDWFDTYLKKP
jgi:dienelactone hydrolase